MPAKTPSLSKRTATAAGEDYLLRIHQLADTGHSVRGVDLAKALGISQPSVTGMIQRLSTLGLIAHRHYREIVLTSAGAEVATRIARRRTILETFLRTLGLDEETIRHDAEGMEHCISDATCDALQRRMKNTPADACHAGTGTKSSTRRHPPITSIVQAPPLVNAS